MEEGGRRLGWDKCEKHWAHFFNNGLLFVSWADLLVFCTSVIRPTRALILILSIHVTKGEEGEGNLAA
jgi:hypothetical protein